MSEVDKVDNSARVDKIIWRNMGLRPVVEIAELAGVEPPVVLRRYWELMESIDALTVEQKRVRLLVELEGMARDARDRAKGTSDEFYAGTINAAVGAIKAQLVELARIEKQNTGAVEVLNSLRIRELLALIDKTVALTVEDIAVKYDIDSLELMEMFQDRRVS